MRVDGRTDGLGCVFGCRVRYVCLGGSDADCPVVVVCAVVAVAGGCPLVGGCPVRHVYVLYFCM